MVGDTVNKCDAARLVIKICVKVQRKSYVSLCLQPGEIGIILIQPDGQNSVLYLIGIAFYSPCSGFITDIDIKGPFRAVQIQPGRNGIGQRCRIVQLMILVFLKSQIQGKVLSGHNRIASIRIRSEI